MIYIFLLLINVTELRPVHVHKPTSNKGGMVQFNLERMIVLNPAKHLTLNRIICFCFNLHFLPLFRTTFNPFLPNLHPLSLSKQEGKKERKLRFVRSFHSILRLVRPRCYNQALCLQGKIKGFFRGGGGFMLSSVIMRPIALLMENQKWEISFKIIDSRKFWVVGQ